MARPTRLSIDVTWCKFDDSFVVRHADRDDSSVVFVTGGLGRASSLHEVADTREVSYRREVQTRQRGEQARGPIRALTTDDDDDR